jgi:hypothetical protein
MENNNEGKWQTPSNKKGDGAQQNVVVHTANTQCASSSNAFALLEEHTEEDTAAPISGDTPSIVTNAKKISWGESEPNVNEVGNVIIANLALCEDFEQGMGFLQSSMATIAASATRLVEKQRADANNAKSSERDTVRGLHDLALFGRSFSQSMTANLTELTAVINSIEKQKNEILEGWNTFVQDLNKTHVDESVQHVQAQPGSFRAALEGVRIPSIVRSPITPQILPIADITVTSIGMMDVTCPSSTNIKNVPLFGIQYNTALSCFMINLDGTVYSFGTGQFMTRKNKHVKGESTMYGKRCDPRAMSCNGINCTYYHDPLKFTNNPHTTRNMAMPYITEDLIKLVASDQDIMSNAPFTSNPFVVEDIVQLAGMLLLKAIVVKNVIKSAAPRARGKSSASATRNTSGKK